MSCLGRGIAVLDVVTDPVGIAADEKPLHAERFTVFPNPAGDKTEFEFETVITGQVQLSVFDMQGRVISVILDQELEAGKHRVPWNCTGGNGNKLMPGLYIARLNEAGKIFSTKVVVR